METKRIIAYALAGLFLIGLCAIWYYHIHKETETPKKQTENFVYTPPANFTVYNYFPSVPIKVDVLPPNTDIPHIIYGTEISHLKPITLIESVAPLKTGTIPHSLVVKHIVRGAVIRISIIDPITKVPMPYTDYMVDTDADERIKNLHVGMITTRYIGGSTDALHLTTTSANAIQGNAWLMIHNLTSLPLRLNDDILVEPHSTFRYLGYLNEGVSLGTYFVDQSGLYPTFQYLRPDNSVYYGLVSDIRQPLYGCFQSEFTDNCEYGQTLWPLEDGVM
jgi:hypothetical protein